MFGLAVLAIVLAAGTLGHPAKARLAATVGEQPSIRAVDGALEQASVTAAVPLAPVAAAPVAARVGAPLTVATPAERTPSTRLRPQPAGHPDGAVAGSTVPRAIRALGHAAIATAGTLKAVIIVGPSGETENNLERAEELALRAEAHGMDVRRVYHPHATWANVLANIQGANLVAYFGHGNGSPSPYGRFQERTKDGFGLNVRDGAAIHQMRYYGAALIRRHVVLAPNAVVALSHLCYAAGNGEPHMAIPTWDVAWQRVDNYASGFLFAGARAVFAYSTGSVTPLVDALFDSDATMDEIFMTRGRRSDPYYGFTGWDDRYYESARTPGQRNHLDPGRHEGFLRALTGDLAMTAADWRSGGSSTADGD